MFIFYLALVWKDDNINQFSRVFLITTMFQKCTISLIKTLYHFLFIFLIYHFSGWNSYVIGLLNQIPTSLSTLAKILCLPHGFRDFNSLEWKKIIFQRKIKIKRQMLGRVKELSTTITLGLYGWSLTQQKVRLNDFLTLQWCISDIPSVEIIFELKFEFLSFLRLVIYCMILQAAAMGHSS